MMSAPNQGSMLETVSKRMYDVCQAISASNLVPLATFYRGEGLITPSAYDAIIAKKPDGAFQQAVMLFDEITKTCADTEFEQKSAEIVIKGLEKCGLTHQAKKLREDLNGVSTSNIFQVQKLKMGVENVKMVGDRGQAERFGVTHMTALVDDAISKVSKCFYPTGAIFLRRIAYTETRFGCNLQIGGSGQVVDKGIWQVDKTMLEYSQRSTPYNQSKKQRINKIFEIDYDKINFAAGDLKDPFTCALVARMYISQYPEAIPNSAYDQAHYWKKYYNASGSVDQFLADVQILEGK